MGAKEPFLKVRRDEWVSYIKYISFLEKKKMNIKGMKMVSATFRHENSTYQFDKCESYKEKLDASKDAYNRLYNIWIVTLVFLYVIVLSCLVIYTRCYRRSYRPPQIEEVNKFTDTSPWHLHFHPLTCVFSLEEH